MAYNIDTEIAVMNALVANETSYLELLASMDKDDPSRDRVLKALRIIRKQIEELI